MNKKGISLAELLAVVVIMGIIAAIAIPLVGNVIEQTREKAVYGDAVTINDAANTYCTLNPDECVAGKLIGSADAMQAAHGSSATEDGAVLDDYISKELALVISEGDITDKHYAVLVSDTNVFEVILVEGNYYYKGNPREDTTEDETTITEFASDNDKVTFSIASGSSAPYSFTTPLTEG